MGTYAPRTADATVLHGVVRDHLDDFLAAAAARTDGTGLPAFIEREVRAFLRYRLAFDHALCRAVLGVFVRAVLGDYRRRARRQGLHDGQGGAVTVIQRFGSGLQLNVHYHSLLVDGVFTEAADGSLRFHPAQPPTDAEVGRLVATVRTRILRLLRRRGVLGEAEEGDAPDPLAETSLV